MYLILWEKVHKLFGQLNINFENRKPSPSHSNLPEIQGPAGEGVVAPSEKRSEGVSGGTKLNLPSEDGPAVPSLGAALSSRPGVAFVGGGRSSFLASMIMKLRPGGTSCPPDVCL